MSDTAPEVLPLIDTHQHLWDFAVIRPPWLNGAGIPLEQSHTPADYAKARADLGIIESVYVEVDSAPGEKDAEARYVAAQIADPAQRLSACILSGSPAAPDFAATLDRQQEIVGDSLRGVRGSFPRNLAASPTDMDAFARGAALLAERDLHFEFLTQPDGLSDVATLAARCPDTRFVLDHCGNVKPWGTPDAFADWQRDMDTLAAFPNLAVKVSGLVNHAPEDWLDDRAHRVEILAERLSPVVFGVWERFGPNRIFWGSDWPVCDTRASLADWVAAFRRITSALPHEHRAALYTGNARRWYRLPDA